MCEDQEQWREDVHQRLGVITRLGSFTRMIHNKSKSSAYLASTSALGQLGAVLDAKLELNEKGGRSEEG